MNKPTVSRLSEDQLRVMSFLQELHELTTQTEVKEITSYLKKFKLTSNYSTTLFTMGIISKTRPYKWLIDQPSPDLAIEVEDQASTYLRIMASKDTFKNLLNDENPFPFAFNKVWPLLGYDQSFNAKRSLIANLENGKDYAILPNEDKTALFEQNQGDTEIIYLSRIGLQLFLATPQKPMGKLFARLFFEWQEEQRKLLKQIDAGVTHIAEKSNLLDDMEESINFLKRYQRNLADEIHRINCDPQQLLMPFERELTRKSVFDAFQEAQRIATRYFISQEETQIQKVNGRLQLPPGFAKGGIA